MYKNKLIRLLRTFSRKEMTRFREFVESPYYNKHQDVRNLVVHLSDIYPRLDEERCDRARLFQQLYPGEPHDQNRLAVIFSYTQRLAEQFLSVEQAGEDPLTGQLYLLRRLRRRKHYRLYEKELQRLGRKVKGLPSGAVSSPYRRFRFAEEADQYFNQIERRQEDWHIQEKQNQLEQFFLAEKLRDACEMHIRSKILKVTYHSGMLQAVLNEVRRNRKAYADSPAVIVYFQLYQMLVQNEQDYYFKALKIFKNYEEDFPSLERETIYNLLQNYCIEQINRGSPRFLREIFELYKAQLEQGLLLEEGFLSEWHYKNIVTTGIRLQALDWVKNFIESYRETLRPESRENAYRFNLASYYYAAGNYEQVLNLLIRVEYSDLRYNLGAKALLLRTYYDLEEYEALNALTESFRQYLQRNQLLADSRREGYYNLFKLTRRAAYFRINMDYFSPEKRKRELQKLRAAIDRESAIFNRNWLEEKVRELERG